MTLRFWKSVLRLAGCLCLSAVGLVSMMPRGTVAAAEKIYDPARDSAADLAAAETTAQQENKHILLDVGGNWCSWCHLLEHFLHEHEKLNAELEQHYVLVHVNWSPDAPNAAFLRQYPAISGYPHLFVLDGKGKLLQSQSTDVFEDGHSYDEGRLAAFLKKWE